MLVYKDLISGDELFTDAYPTKLIQDTLYLVKGKLVTETSDSGNIDIGANPSAEEEQEQMESGSKTGCDIVLANRLVETGFATKKKYLIYMKGYMAKILEKLDESKHAEFKAKMNKVVKELIADKYDEFQFFQGESCEPEAMTALMFYEPDEGTTPWMYFFKEGLIEEKQ